MSCSWHFVLCWPNVWLFLFWSIGSAFLKFGELSSLRLSLLVKVELLYILGCLALPVFPILYSLVQLLLIDLYEERLFLSLLLNPGRTLGFIILEDKTGILPLVIFSIFCFIFASFLLLSKTPLLSPIFFYLIYTFYKPGFTSLNGSLFLVSLGAPDLSSTIPDTLSALSWSLGLLIFKPYKNSLKSRDSSIAVGGWGKSDTVALRLSVLLTLLYLLCTGSIREL